MQASLQESQKNLWHSCIANISDDEARAILDVLRDDINNLDFLTKNSEEKMKAIKSQDRKAWSKIIEEEKKVVEGK